MRARCCGRERDALVELALVLLEREVAQAQLLLGAELGPHLAHARVDVAVAVGARDRHAVVAVLDEVEVADPVDVDRRHRLAAAARLGDPLPALARLRGGAEVAVEIALAAVDGADDRLERDHPDAEVLLARAAERGDDLLEREHERDVVGLGAELRDDAAEGPPPALAIERRLGVIPGHARAHRGEWWHS